MRSASRISRCAITSGLLSLAAAASLLGSRCAAADTGSPTELEQRQAFFEQQILPVLIDRCYRCHSAEQTEPAGGLRVDTRQEIRRGGHSGPAVVPGDVEGSLLMSAIQHDILEMPPDEKLDDEVIASFRQWIADGAHDSREDESAATNTNTMLTDTMLTEDVDSSRQSPQTAAALTAGEFAECSARSLFSPVGPVWLVPAAPGLCWTHSVAGALFMCP